MRWQILTVLIPALAACGQSSETPASDKSASPPGAAAPSATDWRVDFHDDFDSFNPDNWQDQLLWVNDEDQCYVPDGEYNTREVSDGTLKLRVVALDEEVPCPNMSKEGSQHPPTRYVAGRLASKNLQEFVKGRWTARLRVAESGEDGMFPAWWLLGALNNEPPVQEDNETVCWPLTGSGEIDIFEHHSDGGPDHYVARIIDSTGGCDEGDWQTYQKIMSTDLASYHEYSVGWQGADLVFGRDGDEVYRLEDRGDDFPEPLFAILNFAKINDAEMDGEWVMEVDWVRHESRP